MYVIGSRVILFVNADADSKVLEERSVYYRETKNGLYTTLPFVLANTLVNIPFLFVCTVLFTVICYWAIVRLPLLYFQDHGLKFSFRWLAGFTSWASGFLPFRGLLIPCSFDCREPVARRCFSTSYIRCCVGDYRLVSCHCFILKCELLKSLVQFERVLDERWWIFVRAILLTLLA